MRVSGTPRSAACAAAAAEVARRGHQEDRCEQDAGDEQGSGHVVTMRGGRRIALDLHQVVRRMLPPAFTRADSGTLRHALRATRRRRSRGPSPGAPRARERARAVRLRDPRRRWCARVHAYARGAHFLDACGERAIDCGIVLTGVMREYYPLADGREVNRNFAGAGDGVGSLSDLISGEPSRSSVMVETDARVAVFPWRVLHDAAERMPAWRRFVARITERLYPSRRRGKRIRAARARRGRPLPAVSPALRRALEDDIALRQVASYVGDHAGASVATAPPVALTTRRRAHLDVHHG